MKRVSYEEFLIRAIKLYGNKYDYSKVNFKNTSTKICIICSEHGEFLTTPNNFLQGHKCPTCSGHQRITKELFISRANIIHKNRYDYSEIEWKNSNTDVCIICPIHGDFWQKPKYHMMGHGCQKCYATPKSSTKEFIEKAKAIYGEEYDYSKVYFENLDDFVTIICPEHGEFEQRAKVHYRGYGCPICGGSKRLTDNEFIEKAKIVHNNKYDYSKVKYINTATKVCITCRIHGDFWQTPNNHLFGAGCPTCPQSNLEGEIRHFLIKNEIKFEQEKTFDWLIFKRKMFLDFFLPDYGVAIECQGGQHFSPTDLFGGMNFYKLTIERDKIKKELCEKHGIVVLYYSNAHINYPYPVFESVRLLLKAIKQNGRFENQQWNDQLELPFE